MSSERGKAERVEDTKCKDERRKGKDTGGGVKMEGSKLQTWKDNKEHKHL